MRIVQVIKTRLIFVQIMNFLLNKFQNTVIQISRINNNNTDRISKFLSQVRVWLIYLYIKIKTTLLFLICKGNALITFIS